MDKPENNHVPTTCRVNIKVSQKVKRYFECKSLDTGVSQSALMALALEEYIDQKIMLAFTQRLETIDFNLSNKQP